ncbi:MAG: YggS family pyridoxal phosphate-dependent enzyme [Bacteroidia bacterium]|nr:YggS family pyridoxal phosphate-dependent enzyme [Bacteroidia bacterium]
MNALEEILGKVEKYGARLVAVSKTKPNNAILEIYNQGHKIFGENRVQELVEKQASMPDDIEWHMIGHLQSKKVKQIASFVHMIHAVDSPKLLKEIDKRAAQHERIIPVLLQFHIAKESTKYGFSQDEVEALLRSEEFKTFENAKIVGVMGMATFTDDMDQVRSEFKSLKSIFDHLKTNYFTNNEDFKEISMGMSGDYTIALEEGSTIVRVGSLIFGKR